MDTALFQAINGWPDGIAPFFVFLSDATKLWAGRIPLLLLAGYLIYRKDTRLPTICALVAVFLANELTDLLKDMYPMARPSGPVRQAMDNGVAIEDARRLAPNVRIRVTPLGSSGTASAHSANMMAVAAVFGLFQSRWQWLWLPVAVLTGISRVYVGVHYPSQVMLGWACGIAMGIAVFYAATPWRRKATSPENARPVGELTGQDGQTTPPSDHRL